MRTNIAMDGELASRWSDGAERSRAISASATAIAAMPPPIMNGIPPEFLAVFTAAKTQMLSWPFALASDLAGVAGRIAEAGKLAPMLDCEVLEQQLAELGDSEKVASGLASVLETVLNVVRSERLGCEAVVERLSRWRGSIDETRQRLSDMQCVSSVNGDATLRRSVDLLGESIDHFAASRLSATARPRVVLAWLDRYSATAFGIASDDVTAAALVADPDVVDAHQSAAEAFAPASAAVRWHVLIDVALANLDAASSQAQGLEDLAADTAGAWQPIEDRLRLTTSDLRAAGNSAIRSFVERARREVQCLNDVQDVFRAAARPVMAIVTEPVEIRLALPS